MLCQNINMKTRERMLKSFIINNFTSRLCEAILHTTFSCFLISAYNTALHYIAEIILPEHCLIPSYESLNILLRWCYLLL